MYVCSFVFCFFVTLLELLAGKKGRNIYNMTIMAINHTKEATKGLGSDGVGAFFRVSELTMKMGCYGSMHGWDCVLARACICLTMF